MINVLNIKSKPNQVFITTVSINNVNVTYLITLIYRDKIGYWTMDIQDYATGNYVLSNVPLLSYSDGINVYSIIRQMAYMHIGRIYVIKKVNSTEDSPSFETIQTDYDIVWGDN